MSVAKENEVKFSEQEQKEIERSVASIRKVLNRHNLDLTSIVSAVSAVDVAATRKAVEVRFDEEHAHRSVMNMVAFD